MLPLVLSEKCLLCAMPNTEIAHSEIFFLSTHLDHSVFLSTLRIALSWRSADTGCSTQYLLS